uniref:Uncharacterized protein n=1 Tax=Oryza brachyantha TaxID=4533 RepID=J3L2X3_ORYBR
MQNCSYTFTLWKQNILRYQEFRIGKGSGRRVGFAPELKLITRKLSMFQFVRVVFNQNQTK